MIILIWFKISWHIEERLKKPYHLYRLKNVGRDFVPTPGGGGGIFIDFCSQASNLIGALNS